MAEKFQSFIFFFLFVCNCLTFSESGKVPAMYVFGDSLVDVGNNNYLKLPAARADFYPYGIDFPTGKPTGRFCNGKNAADFLAEKVGLPAAPPYLAVTNQTDRFKTGVNFGSGGAGIISQLEDKFNSIALNQQVNYYTSVYDALGQNLGRKEARARASKSLFLIEIGSNDIFAYGGSSSLRKAYTSHQYLSFMSRQFQLQLKRLYENGARKVVVIGVGAIGCTPAMRLMNNTGACNSQLNTWSYAFNQQLKSVLRNLEAHFLGFHYSYFDGFSLMLHSIHNPTSFGFGEVGAACCGGGRLKAGVGCTPRADYCGDRERHLFWDPYHPTQQAHRLFSDFIFDGPKTYAFPLNLQTLISI